MKDNNIVWCAGFDRRTNVGVKIICPNDPGEIDFVFHWAGFVRANTAIAARVVQLDFTS